MISVSVDNRKQLNEVLSIKEVDEIIINRESFNDENIRELLYEINNKQKIATLMLETITRLSQNDEEKRLYELISFDEVQSIIVQNVNSYFFILNKIQKKLSITFNYNMNVYNSFTKQSFIDFGKGKFNNYKFVAPVELNFRELENVGYDYYIVYAYLPLMVSKNCIFKNTGKCKHNMYDIIYDRLNVGFRFKSYCSFCYNKIFNSVPIDIRDVDNINIINRRYDFTFEESSIIRDIIFNKYHIANKTKGHYNNTIE